MFAGRFYCLFEHFLKIESQKLVVLENFSKSSSLFAKVSRIAAHDTNLTAEINVSNIVQFCSLARNKPENKANYIFLNHSHWFQGAKTGKDNGYTILLDIESFDYEFFKEGSEGLKVALVHHLVSMILTKSIKVESLSNRHKAQRIS